MASLKEQKSTLTELLYASSEARNTFNTEKNSSLKAHLYMPFINKLKHISVLDPCIF